MNVKPYLYFDGCCERALEFYQQALGARVDVLMRFKDNPDPNGCQGMPPDSAEKVMHCSFHIGDTEIMASDGNCQGKAAFQGISLTITAATPEEAERLFNALGDGGQVQMPMMTTFFSPRFGMVADKFGVSWMVLAAQPN